MPQGAMHVMNPVKIENSCRCDSKEKERKGRAGKRITAYLKELELPHEVLDAYPHQLSGECGRESLSPCHLPGTDLVLADEPTTALDGSTEGNPDYAVKSRRNSKFHGHRVSRHGVHHQITDRLGIMYAGQMIEDGPTGDIRESKHPIRRCSSRPCRLGMIQKGRDPGLPQV